MRFAASQGVQGYLLSVGLQFGRIDVTTLLAVTYCPEPRHGICLTGCQRAEVYCSCTESIPTNRSLQVHRDCDIVPNWFGYPTHAYWQILHYKLDGACRSRSASSSCTAQCPRSEHSKQLRWQRRQMPNSAVSMRRCLPLSALRSAAELPRCCQLSLHPARGLASTGQRRWSASAATRAAHAAPCAPRRRASGMTTSTTARHPPAPSYSRVDYKSCKYLHQSHVTDRRPKFQFQSR